MGCIGANGEAPNADFTACEACPTANGVNPTTKLCEPCDPGVIVTNGACAAQACNKAGGEAPNADFTACEECPGDKVPNDDGSTCICPIPGQEADASNMCTCPTNSALNVAKDACEETFFWVIVVAGHTFDDVLNSDGSLAAVTAELQEPICEGTPEETGCTVTVISFSSGSTNINGQTTQVAGDNNEENVQSEVVDAALQIVALGNEVATSSSSSTTNFAKCTAEMACAAADGDCDTNDQCAGTLECGVNNCGEGFDPLADCCYDPALLIESDCNGGSSNMWTCCKDKLFGCVGDSCTAAGCAAGEGDCDDDDECADSLVCGRNSCDTAFNTNLNTDKFFPSGQADCCITKSRALFYGIPSRSDLEENFQNDDEPF